MLNSNWKNYVKFSLAKNQPIYAVPFEATATFEIYDINTVTSQRTLRTTIQSKLVYSNETLQTEKDVDLVALYNPTDRFEVRVKQVSIKEANRTYPLTSSNITAANAAILDLLRLEAVIEYDRFMPMACDAVTKLNALVLDSDKNTLKVAVNTSTTYDGVVAYDIEWVYLDDYLISSTGTQSFKAANKIPVNFKKNAARVQVTSGSYEIPLVYERGYLVVRARAVGYDAAKRYVYGKWTDVNVSNKTVAGYVAMAYKIGTAHENLLNWQAVTTYAEDGKRKDVVKYLDGAMYSRQDVTYVNSDNKAVVAEQYYDYFGRPAVTALPAPVNSAKLQYYNSFNNATISTAPSYEPYNKKHFDIDGSNCNPVVTAMHPVPAEALKGGSAKYYSDRNPWLNDGISHLIPRSAKPGSIKPGASDPYNYPFSQVEYMPDATGRIARQGGVGLDYQLGSGHETKMFYATPNQEELTALFGNNVGDALHYHKTMTRDANGQLSIAYTDAHGRTVATALAGNKPDATDALALAAGQGEMAYTEDYANYNVVNT